VPTEKRSPLKAMTLKMPAAPAVAADLKTIECRTWNMRHRGDIAIHYGLGAYPEEECPEAYRILDDLDVDLDWGRGCVIAVATVVDCVPMLEPPAVPPRAFAGPEPGLYVGKEALVLRRREGRGVLYMDEERPFGTFQSGWHAIVLDCVRPLPEPVQCGGGQRIFHLDIQVEAEVWNQLT
jgi:hypothetical protein